MGNILSGPPDGKSGPSQLAVPRGPWSELDDRAVRGAIGAARKSGGGKVVIESGSQFKLSIEVPGEHSGNASGEGQGVNLTALIILAATLAFVLVPWEQRGSPGVAQFATSFVTSEDLISWTRWKVLEVVWSAGLVLLARYLTQVPEFRAALCF